MMGPTPAPMETRSWSNPSNCSLGAPVLPEAIAQHDTDYTDSMDHTDGQGAGSGLLTAGLHLRSSVPVDLPLGNRRIRSQKIPFCSAEGARVGLAERLENEVDLSGKTGDSACFLSPCFLSHVPRLFPQSPCFSPRRRYDNPHYISWMFGLRSSRIL